jgi:hypothetical protein
MKRNTGRDHEPAAADDRSHGRQHRQRLHPGGQVGDQAGRMGVGGQLNRSGREQRQQGEQRDDRQVLQQQHPEGRPADGTLSQPLLVEGLQHDRRRGHRQHEAGRQRRRPGQSEDHAGAGDGQGRGHDLRAAEAEDGLAHRPEQGGAHLQPDQEQQDHHAELGEGHDVLGLARQVEREGADQGAGDQVAEHRAEPELLDGMTIMAGGFGLCGIPRKPDRGDPRLRRQGPDGHLQQCRRRRLRPRPAAADGGRCAR